MIDRSREGFEKYIKGIYPNAVFKDEDGKDIFWIPGCELQFVTHPDNLEKMWDDGIVHSCYIKGGKFIETDEF